MRNCENLDKAIYEGVGPYDIPQMSPVHIEPVEFIGFNYAKGFPDPASRGVHFFVNDYQFFRLWTGVELYMPILSRFNCVCTPDFSMYTDFPLAVQIYNHYRKHWLGSYWQQRGLTVIPTISWSDETSFAWCFDGDPIGGDVAISSVGTQMNDGSRKLFMLGYDEMLARLNPSTIFFHGAIPEGCGGNIMPIPAYQGKLRSIPARKV